MTLFGENVTENPKHPIKTTNIRNKRLIGQRFGKLKIVSLNSFKKNGAFWNCVCDCGNMCTAREVYLKNGVKTNCGGSKHQEKKKETWATKAIGMKFSRLTVLEYIGKNKWGKFLFNCKCDCGNITTANISELKRGAKKSCGCLLKDFRGNGGRKHSISGQKFGKLVAIKEVGRSPSGDIRWLCRCDCGGEIIKKASPLKNGNTFLHCGCVVKEKKAKPVKIKKKPVDREQYAKDLYCWYREGWSIRDIAADNGYKRGMGITKLFNDFIPGYKEKSKIRREASEYKQQEQRSLKRSKKYRYEKDFNNYCVSTLEDKGEYCSQNDIDTTGLEIDIKTNTNCYELKITSRKKDLFTAFGQLIINSQLSGLTPSLVIPSDITIPKIMKDAYERNGISIYTDETL